MFLSLESSPRNPVTGDGVVSWDSRPSSRNTPRPRMWTTKHPVYTMVNYNANDNKYSLLQKGIQ